MKGRPGKTSFEHSQPKKKGVARKEAFFSTEAGYCGTKTPDRRALKEKTTSGRTKKKKEAQLTKRLAENFGGTIG